MKRACLMACLTLAASAQAADTFPAKKIQVNVGDRMSLNPILSLPYDGPAAKRPLRVRETVTAKEFPASIYDGQLYFIPEGGMPNTEHVYKLNETDLGTTYEPIVNIKKRGDEPVFDVYIEDQLFTAYYAPADGKKPYLWPLNAEGGQTLTRDYPMDPNNKPSDHPHHKSVWSAFGAVNGVDCWAEGEDSGFQQSGEVTAGSGDAFGWIHAKNVWQDKDHKPLIDEEREYRFYGTPASARVFDVTITFSANYGDVTFGDTKEGGLVALRMRQELCGSKGVITNALGDAGEPTLWGKPSPWCDYSGMLGDLGPRGVAIFDTPGNLRYPTSWHVRSYGLMAANAFGWNDFREKEYNKPLIPETSGDFKIANGEKLTMKYRVYVHSGDVNAAAVADRFADYTSPPAAKWLD